MPSEGIITNYSLLALVPNPTPQHVSIKCDKNRGVIDRHFRQAASTTLTGSLISVGYTASLSPITAIYLYECLLSARFSFLRKASKAIPVTGRGGP
jgi:hypothetical protein